MPYYCTVPRCTSMAGKAKNVSFHQFPRDEELAQLWNNILKRGKPYTKYSKVCSLHFRPEDYTITSVGKNKGQWRTLRKDAIPSRNLPSESPPTQRRSRTWTPHHEPTSPGSVDPQMHQNIAQLIYLQTMLAMQANTAEPHLNTPHGSTIAEVDRIRRNGDDNHETMSADECNDTDDESITKTSFKCEECSKCFKDPDVYKLHQRTHKKTHEKENLNSNISKFNDKTIKANPILTNLLNNDMARLPDSFISNDNKNIETQIMQAFAANMESYINNLKSVLLKQNGTNSENDDDGDDENVDEDSWKEKNDENTKDFEENDANSDVIEKNFKVDITIEEVNEKCEERNGDSTDIDDTNTGVSEKVSEISETDNTVDEDKTGENNLEIYETSQEIDETTQEISENTPEITKNIPEITEKLQEVSEKVTETEAIKETTENKENANLETILESDASECVSSNVNSDSTNS